MKAKVGDKVTTDTGEAEIVFIGTQTVVYRDERGEEWCEEEYELSAAFPAEIDFMKKPEKRITRK